MCCYNKKDIVDGWPKRILKKDAVIGYKTLVKNRHGVWQSPYIYRLWHKDRMQARSITFDKRDNSRQGVYACVGSSMYAFSGEQLVKLKLYGTVYKFDRSTSSFYTGPGYMATRAEIVGVVK